MKKILLATLIVAFLISCGNKETKKNEEDFGTSTTVSDDKTAKPETVIPAEFQKGAELIAANDCLTCHKTDEKVVGPSYKDVATKYTSKDTEMLVNKIIQGGKGNWSEIPMTPHPTVSKEDASEMVKYILSIK